MTTPVDPVDKPNTEDSIAGDMIDPLLQENISENPDDHNEGDVE